MAVKAKTAGDIEGQHHAIARLDALDGLANFFDYPHYLVADDSTFAQRSSAIVHMQIAAANTGCCDSQQSVGWFPDFGFGMT
jgi:hypothetical protein